MASNPYVNKVQTAEGNTIMDISGDTVTPSDVLNGVTFHSRSGAAQQGNLITHNVYDGLDSTSTSDALSAKQGKVLNDHIVMVLTSGNLKTFASSAGEGFTCFRYNNNVTNTPCDYGHGYLIKYGQNCRFEVYDMITINIFTAYSRDNGNTWSDWYSANLTRV